MDVLRSSGKLSSKGIREICPKGLLPRHILEMEASPLRHPALVDLGELELQVGSGPSR
jgi:hypothetical protein